MGDMLNCLSQTLSRSSFPFCLEVVAEVRMLSNFESNSVLCSLHFSTQADVKLSSTTNRVAIGDKMERRVRKKT